MCVRVCLHTAIHDGRRFMWVGGMSRRKSEKLIPNFIATRMIPRRHGDRMSLKKLFRKAIPLIWPPDKVFTIGHAHFTRTCGRPSSKTKLTECSNHKSTKTFFPLRAHAHVLSGHGTPPATILANAFAFTARHTVCVCVWVGGPKRRTREKSHFSKLSP